MRSKRRLYILLTVTAFIIIQGCSSDMELNVTQDKIENEEIQQAALDYIEGWYEGNEHRMKKTLHPEMIKRRFEGDILKELDTKQMVSSTKQGGGKNVPRDSFDIEVEILDISNNIASVVTKSQYIDYLHLAKVNGKWVIINVLWDLNR